MIKNFQSFSDPILDYPFLLNLNFVLYDINIYFYAVIVDYTACNLLFERVFFGLSSVFFLYLICFPFWKFQFYI